VKGFLILAVVLLAGYGGIKGMEMFKANGDFTDRVDHQLDFVDENSMDSVKKDLIADAKKLGIDITTNDVHILYEDTEQRTVAQSFVGRKVGVDFINKRIAINVVYVQRILGIPFHQDITRSKIKQVEAPRKQVSPEMQQLLESAPQ